MTDLRSTNYLEQSRTEAVGQWTMPKPQPWTADALCAQIGGDTFFPEKGESNREAKKICTACAVIGECLAYALEHDERWGVWGGVGERDRRRLRRARRD